MEKIKTNYKLVENTEKNGIELYFDDIPTKEERDILKNNGYKWHNVKKCWYKSNNSNNATVKEIKKDEVTKHLRLATSDEVDEIVKNLWQNDERMQKYAKNTYDYYILSDGYILEFEKVNKRSLTTTFYYDDETEAPSVTFNNFVYYNRHNIPFNSLTEYLNEKKRLQEQGCATGRYDYKGIYISTQYQGCKNIVFYDFHDEKDERFFIRYLTEEEQQDFIKIAKKYKKAYMERLEKYFKRYGHCIRTHGYWANR